MDRRIHALLISSLLLVSSLTAGCTLLEKILSGLSRVCETDPLVVTKADDSNDGLCSPDDCSLREAVITANSCPGHQTIQLPPAAYHLTRVGAGEDGADTGDLDITDDLTINGVEAPSIHGDSQDRVIEIFDPAVVELNLLIIVEGQEQTGAGIWNHGILTFSSGAVNNNHAQVPPGGVGTSGGGGLHNDQGAQATILGTQFLENSADHGGAIHNFAVAQLTVDGGLMQGNVAHGSGGAIWNNSEGVANLANVDFIGNQADVSGGAIYNDGRLETDLNKLEENTEADQGGGIYNGPDAEAFMYNAWFSNNSADLGGAVFNQGLLHLYQSSLTVNTAFAGFGGGAYNDGAEAALLLQNTTVSSNMIVPPGSPGGSGVYNGGGDLRLEFSTFAYNNADGVLNDGGHGTIESTVLAYHANGNCAGDPLLSGGHNLEDGDSCGLIEPSDLVSSDPTLAPLDLYGGTNLIHALLPGSPALDSGDMDTCISLDQRGVTRPQAGRCDRGAYEAEEGPPLGGTDLAPAATATPEITSTPWPAISINFNADAYEIYEGSCTTLRWEVENAELVFFEGASVPSLEAEQVCPLSTTSYGLSASNPAEEAAAEVTIYVLEPPPADPGSLKLNPSCGGSSYTVGLSWEDRADNEEGYYVYRDGERIATLGEDAESYNDDPGQGGPYKYAVAAFNDAGTSDSSGAQAPACP